MTPETNPLKYLPLIGAGIFVVFWGTSQVVQASISGQRAQTSASRSAIKASTLPKPVPPPTSNSGTISAPTCGIASTRT